MVTPQESDRIAKAWLKCRYSTADIFLEKEYLALRKYMKKNTLTLDLMCGPGVLAERFPASNIVAVDFSRAMLNLARNNNRNIKPVLADATKLPFSNNSFSLVFCMGNSIPDLPSSISREIVISEAHRVIKKNGVFILSFVNRYGIDTELPKRIIWHIIHLISTNNVDPWGWRYYSQYMNEYIYMHYYSIPEMKKVLYQAGFRMIQLESRPLDTICIISCRKK